jgi:hypothetical protein
LTWVGAPIRIAPMSEWRLTPAGPILVTVPNPNALTIRNGRLAGAVVWLEGVDPAASKPWDRPPVRVTANDDGIFPNGSRYGFARVGEPVEFVSTVPELLGVRGRGAAGFTVMLPERGNATRTFNRPGRIELTTAANLHWAVADLFVCDHPYFATTDYTGRFRFDQVPAGEYVLASRVPNWQIASHDRDPETGAISRRRYAPVAETRTPVRVTRTSTSTVVIAFSLDQFPAR